MGTVNALVVDARSPLLALAAARIGATVVVVGADAEAVGALARAVDAAGGRALVFVGEPGSGLAEMLAEMCRRC